MSQNLKDGGRSKLDKKLRNLKYLLRRSLECSTTEAAVVRSWAAYAASLERMLKEKEKKDE